MRLVDGLKDTATTFPEALELIIVDNNSDEIELLELLEELTQNQTNGPFAAIQILRYPGTFNYSAINNLAVSKSHGQYLCFLNNDIEIIDTTWLTALCDALQQSDAGCAGAMLYYPDNTIQHAGVYLDTKSIAGHLYKHAPRGSAGHNHFLVNQQVVSAVTAACMLVTRQLFDQVGGFDESLSVAFNDVDFCLKVKRAGYNNVWTPAAALYHHESKSRGLSHQRSLVQKFNHKKAVLLMKRRWRAELQHEKNHPDKNTVAENNQGTLG